MTETYTCNIFCLGMVLYLGLVTLTVGVKNAVVDVPVIVCVVAPEKYKTVSMFE